MHNFDCDSSSNTEPFSKRQHMRLLMAAALISTCIIIGTFLRIPFLFGIPITFQVPMIQVATFALPKPYGIYSVCTYLLLGAAGFPVFTAGGGIGLFFEKTGGYLVGFFIATLIFQLMKSWWKENIALLFIALFLHTALIFLCGMSWHCHIENLAFHTLAASMSPFFAVAFCKLFLSLFLILQFQKMLRS